MRSIFPADITLRSSAYDLPGYRVVDGRDDDEAHLVPCPECERPYDRDRGVTCDECAAVWAAWKREREADRLADR